jgi:hypothetical protein
MADKKISELTETLTVSSTDVVPVVKSGATMKVKVVNLVGGLPGSTSTGGIPNLYDPNSDGVLRLLTISGFATSLEAEGVGGNGKAYISARDVIMAVQGGTPPFTYYLKKDGGSYGAGHADPTAERLSYSYSDVGMVSFWIKISDSAGKSTSTNNYITLQDNKPIGK